MDKRADWALSSSSLRKTLKEVEERHYDSVGNRQSVNYKFGAVLNSRYGYWQVWNAMARNVIATIKFGDKNVIRYRPNSHYAPIILNRTWRGETQFVPSQNLHRHRAYARRAVHNRAVELTRRVRGERNEEQTEVFDIRHDPTNDFIEVRFNNSFPYDEIVRQADRVVHELGLQGTDLHTDILTHIIQGYGTTSGLYAVHIPAWRFHEAVTGLSYQNDAITYAQEYEQAVDRRLNEDFGTTQVSETSQLSQADIDTLRRYTFNVSEHFSEWSTGYNSFYGSDNSMTTDEGGTDVQEN